jgi:hypothetical protein
VAKLSLVAFARKNPPKRSGVPCWICERPKIAKEIAEARRAGAVSITVTWKWLREKHKYPRARNAVGHHVREHLS